MRSKRHLNRQTTVQARQAPLVPLHFWTVDRLDQGLSTIGVSDWQQFASIPWQHCC